MDDFMIRFGLCNLVLCGAIGILLLAKKGFQKSLSSRMQYHLWFLLLGLLAVPFLPLPLMGFPEIFSWLKNLGYSAASPGENTARQAIDQNPAAVGDWMNDFALSVDKKTASAVGNLLFGIWIAGILVMLLLLFRSWLRFRALKKSALPLQNPRVRRLYQSCLNELDIHKNLPIYSTAFLKSPVMAGCLRPGIYLPLHLISDYRETDMRYMLLHELQHYRHKDAWIGFFMNLAKTIYWFHPLVWYALKEMRDDREIVCDTAVLRLLDESAYPDYGNTLLHFAETVSHAPSPFAAELGGSKKQITRRILNIVSYEKPTVKKKLQGMTAFVLTALLLLGFTPFLSARAAENPNYIWNISEDKISTIDVSGKFGAYTGSFVLYDLQKDHWLVSDREAAAVRSAPNSTYKIYDALFALDAGIISSEASTLPWDKTPYPFETWNKDQTLQSAMASSVNWYFQTLDRQLGRKALQSYLHSIGYGNETIRGALSSYWMESSLKISPAEQVALLVSLYQNDLPFALEHIQAVKDTLFLSASGSNALYGKTGTGAVNGQDVNGWFVGFVEAQNRTCFFATNIHAEDDATGSTAAEITLSILSALSVWE